MSDYVTWRTARPCSRCGKTERCSISSEDTEICRTSDAWQPGDRIKTDRSGEEYAVLKGDGEHANAPPHQESYQFSLADEPTRHGVFAEVLASFRPVAPTLAELYRRGFTPEDVQRLGYGRSPDDDRVALALEQKLGRDALTGTPGFWQSPDGIHLFTPNGGQSAIPVRNVAGQIGALRIRTSNEDRKWIWWSYPALEGVLRPEFKAIVHVPLHTPDMRNGTVILTEGEVKADLTTLRTGVLCISIPGVSQWSLALPVLKELGARRVVLAFDGDARRKPGVAGALQRCAAALSEEGYEIAVAVWHEEAGKGIDDVIVNPIAGPWCIELHEGRRAWEMISTLVASSGAKPLPLFLRPRDDAGTVAYITAFTLQRELIILYGKQFYILRDSGEYSRPLQNNEVARCLFDELAWAENAEVIKRFYLKEIEDKDGNRQLKEVEKSTNQLLDECCTVVQGKASASFATPRSYYNPSTESYVEALCKRREIKPKFDEQVDRWLRLLGGDKAESLLDWIATLTDLSRATSILLLLGPKSAGKTMMALGLARIWTDGGPTELEKILGRFNDGITQCPLVFADEGIPKVKGRSVTQDLRRIFSSTTQTLSRKFMSDMPVRGALRGIIAANGEQSVFDFGEDLTSDDAEAIAARFLHIPIQKERIVLPDGSSEFVSFAGRYLESIGGRSGTSDWVTGDRIAAHAVWLSENRVVIPGARFLVEGQAREIVDRVAVGSGLPSLLCQWIVLAILEARERKPDSRPHGSVDDYLVRKDGELYVAPKAFIGMARWTRYVPMPNKLPNATSAGTALGMLAHAGDHRGGALGSSKDDRRMRFRRISLERLLAWADTSGICHPSAIKDWVGPKIRVATSQTQIPGWDQIPGSPKHPGSQSSNDYEPLKTKSQDPEFLPVIREEMEGDNEEETIGTLQNLGSRDLTSNPSETQRNSDPTRFEQPGINHQPGIWEANDPPAKNVRSDQAAHDSTEEEPPRPARCLRGHWPPNPGCGYCDPAYFDENGNVRDVS